MNETAADMNREPKGPTTRTGRRSRPKLSQPYVFSTIEIVAHIPDDELRERSVVLSEAWPGISPMVCQRTTNVGFTPITLKRCNSTIPIYDLSPSRRIAHYAGSLRYL